MADSRLKAQATRWSDPASFFADDLPTAFTVQPCALIVFTYPSWRDAADTQGRQVLDATIEEIKGRIARAVPVGTVLTQPAMSHVVALIAGNFESATSIAAAALEQVEELVVQSAQEPVQMSLVAGVASSETCLSAAHMVYDALLGALAFAPHLPRRIATFRRPGSAPIGPPGDT